MRIPGILFSDYLFHFLYLLFVSFMNYTGLMKFFVIIFFNQILCSRISKRLIDFVYLIKESL